MAVVVRCLLPVMGKDNSITAWCRNPGAMSFKVDSFVRPFSGASGEDFQEFWGKFVVLCNIQKWTINAEQVQFLRLFLKGDAFLVFSRLADGNKKKANDVKTKLEEAFCVSKAQAYELFPARRLRQDVSVTIYAADLERLAVLAGHSMIADDTMVVEQLTTGLPGDFARQVCLSFTGEDIIMSALIEKVRALCASSSDVNSARNMAGAATGPDSSIASSTLCHHCHEVGHIRRLCPKRKGHHGSGSGMPMSRVVCFCKKPGHFIGECRERKAWLASKSGKAAALEVCAHYADPCLSLTAQARRGLLPRMFVNVRPGGDESLNGQEESLSAVVDIGSTHTLIARNCVD